MELTHLPDRDELVRRDAELVSALEQEAQNGRSLEAVWQINENTGLLEREYRISDPHFDQPTDSLPYNVSKASHAELRNIQELTHAGADSIEFSFMHKLSGTDKTFLLELMRYKTIPDIINFLKEKIESGKMFLGNGYFSRVYAIPNTNLVVKTVEQRHDPAYEIYARHAFGHSHENPHLPRIFAMIQGRGCAIYIINLSHKACIFS